MKNNPDIENLILELVDSMDTKQFDLFLQLYNKFYNKSKGNDPIFLNIFNMIISRVCFDRLKTENTIKRNYTNVGGMPLQLNKWWWDK